MIHTVTIKSQNRVKAVFIGVQGPRGADGGDATVSDKLAFQNLGGHRVVIAKSATEVDYADNQVLTHKHLVFGITTASANAGQIIQVRTLGLMNETSWNWVEGLPIFCGTNGLLTQTPPSSGFLISVAVAISPTTILVSIKQPIILI